MRLLDRNKQIIYYRNYSSMTPIKISGTDIETGEYKKTYGALQSATCYVKSALGNNAADPFGDFTTKNRTVYIKDTDINEYSLLWVGIDPSPNLQGEPTVPHNYTVSGVAHGLNHVRLLIRQVEVNV